MNKPMIYLGYIGTTGDQILVAAFTAEEALARMQELKPGKEIGLSGSVTDNVVYRHPDNRTA